jgi:hypothetical protein
MNIPNTEKRKRQPTHSGGMLREDYYFKGGAAQLAERLVRLFEKIRNNSLWEGNSDRAVRIVKNSFGRQKHGCLTVEVKQLL